MTEATEEVDYKQLRTDLLGWVEEQPVTDPQEADNESDDEVTVELPKPLQAFDSRHNFVIERANGEEIGVRVVMHDTLWWVYIEYGNGWELIQNNGTGYVAAMHSISCLRNRIHEADDLLLVEPKQPSLLESMGWGVLVVFLIWLGFHLIEWLVKQ